MAVRTPVPAWLESHLPVCEGVALLFHPLVEVAVHDLRRGRIVAIWNPIAGGKVGDRSGDKGVPAVEGQSDPAAPYTRVLTDGRQVTSMDVTLRNAKGAMRGLLRITFDRGPFDGMIDLLVRFGAPAEDKPRGGPPEADWREQIGLVVEEECRSRGLRRDRLSRDQRLELVRVLDGRGLFATRNAAAHVGVALGISRTTVYALLKEARS